MMPSAKTLLILLALVLALSGGAYWHRRESKRKEIGGERFTLLPQW